MAESGASWTIDVHRKALKELSALPKPIATRCWQAIRELAEDPFPQGTRALEGMESGYRIRVGDYRIVYQIHQSEVRVLVIRVRHRKDVYRGL